MTEHTKRKSTIETLDVQINCDTSAAMASLAALQGQVETLIQQFKELRAISTDARPSPTDAATQL